MERIRQASRAGTLAKGAPESLAQAALGKGVVTPAEARLLEDAAAARRQAIAVDSFSPAEYFRHALGRAERSQEREGAETPEGVLAP